MKPAHAHSDGWSIIAAPPESQGTKSTSTIELARQSCLGLAEALECLFTPRAIKRSAAALLRNALLQGPICKFCGTARGDGTELHQSLDPTTWICTYCAWYIAHRRDIARREVTWERMKEFAP